jgi:DNA (cytosine-5)-methyltransferase 1
VRFGSICSGIEAASVAWHPLGWETAYVAEIEPFPCHVLAQRLGAGRPIYMPEPEAVEFPEGWDEARAAEIDVGDGMERTEEEVAALGALQDLRSRRAAIRAVSDIPAEGAMPNYGDFTRIIELAERGEAPEIDLLVGGTPCQAFSVAGARQGLNDDRGNLTLQFVRLVHASKSLRWAVWENVPGVLSDDTNAFGCFLGGLVGADDPLHVPGGGRWPSAGMVCGPLGRAAWRVLDAQHFALAQRRSRVFVVFCPRAAGGDPAAVLFERQGMPWDFAPGDEAGEGTADGAGEGVEGGGQCAELAPALTASGRGVERTGESRGQDPVVAVDAPELARCIATREGNSQDWETTTMVAHTLRADGFDASEDGTGRGTPLVPCPAPIAFSSKDYGNDSAVDLAPTLRAGEHAASHANAGAPPAIALALRGREDGAQPEIEGDIAGAQRSSNGGSSRSYVAHAPEVAQPIRTNPYNNSDPGMEASMHIVQEAHAFDARQTDVCQYGDQAGTLDTDASTVAVQPTPTSAVRRLTPRECERLQGFPDDWTRIRVRFFKNPKITKNRPTDMWDYIEGGAWLMAADGPRYKSLGNSMARTVMRWLGERIQAYEDGTLDTWRPTFLQRVRDAVGVALNFQASQSGVRLNDTAGTLDANYGSRRHNGVLQ